MVLAIQAANAKGMAPRAYSYQDDRLILCHVNHILSNRHTYDRPFQSDH
jgi:hypothetical protein